MTPATSGSIIIITLQKDNIVVPFFLSGHNAVSFVLTLRCRNYSCDVRCSIAVQVPLTAVLLLFELTHDYFIIIPTLASVGISYWVASFPLAAVLRPLLPIFRFLPAQDPALHLSGSAQSRSILREEVSAALSSTQAQDAMPPLMDTAVSMTSDQACLYL